MAGHLGGRKPWGSLGVVFTHRQDTSSWSCGHDGAAPACMRTDGQRARPPQDSPHIWPDGRVHHDYRVFSRSWALRALGPQAAMASEVHGKGDQGGFSQCYV